MCKACKDTGMIWVGTGHRMPGYPFAEQHAADMCSCNIGVEKAALFRQQEADSRAREKAARDYADDHMAHDIY